MSPVEWPPRRSVRHGIRLRLRLRPDRQRPCPAKTPTSAEVSYERCCIAGSDTLTTGEDADHRRRVFIFQRDFSRPQKPKRSHETGVSPGGRRGNHSDLARLQRPPDAEHPQRDHRSGLADKETSEIFAYITDSYKLSTQDAPPHYRLLSAKSVDRDIFSGQDSGRRRALLFSAWEPVSMLRQVG